MELPLINLSTSEKLRFKWVTEEELATAAVSKGMLKVKELLSRSSSKRKGGENSSSGKDKTSKKANTLPSNQRGIHSFFSKKGSTIVLETGTA